MALLVLFHRRNYLVSLFVFSAVMLWYFSSGCQKQWWTWEEGWIGGGECPEGSWCLFSSMFAALGPGAGRNELYEAISISNIETCCFLLLSFPPRFACTLMPDIFVRSVCVNITLSNYTTRKWTEITLTRLIIVETAVLEFSVWYLYQMDKVTIRIYFFSFYRLTNT